jgi:Zn-dependent protease with chaperone function
MKKFKSLLGYWVFIGILIVSYLQIVSRTNVPDILPEVHPELLPYVIKFTDELKTHNPKLAENHIIRYRIRKLRVDIVDLDFLDIFQSGKLTNMIAACNMISGNVLVHSRFYEDATPTQLEMVMFHELGHCVLLRDHVDVRQKFGPRSIMYPYLFEESTYLEHRDYYLRELFFVL